MASLDTVQSFLTEEHSLSVVSNVQGDGAVLSAELIGPDDNAHGLDAVRIRILLRDIFTAAGGDHDDWDTYDQTMRDQARTAVLIAPDRIRGNS